MSTNKIILLVVFIVLILGLSFVIVLKILPLSVNQVKQNINALAVNQPIAPAVPSNEYVPAPAFALAYYREKSISDKSLLPCLKLTAADLQQGCLQNAELYLLDKAADAKFCLQLKLAADQYDCVKEFAFIHSQPDQCNVLSSDQINDCKVYYALNKAVLGDPSVCQIITDAAKKTQCADTAYFYQGSDGCNKISNASLKQTCLSKAY